MILESSGYKPLRLFFSSTVLVEFIDPSSLPADDSDRETFGTAIFVKVGETRVNAAV